MKHKVLISLLLFEALICLGMTLFNVTSSGSALMTLSTFPFAQIGSMLRQLSLSGMSGNVYAIIIFILIGIIPLIFLSINLFKKKFKIEDSMLVAISVLIFVTIYYMINPTSLGNLFIINGLAQYGEMMLGITVYSILVGYFVFRFIRIISSSETSVLLKYAKTFFFIISIVLVYTIFGSQVNNLVSDINSVTSGNTSSGIMPSILNENTLNNNSVLFTNIFLVLFYIINQIPILLDILIVFITINLIDELVIDRYSDGVIIAANKLASMCKISIMVSMLTCMFVNIIQLIFSRYLLKLNVTTFIPLISIALVLIVLLLAKYFAQSNKLKHDIDLFV